VDERFEKLWKVRRGLIHLPGIVCVAIPVLLLATQNGWGTQAGTHHFMRTSFFITLSNSFNALGDVTCRSDKLKNSSPSPWRSSCGMPRRSASRLIASVVPRKYTPCHQGRRCAFRAATPHALEILHFRVEKYEVGFSFHIAWSSRICFSHLVFFIASRFLRPLICCSDLPSILWNLEGSDDGV
jgi:hypothetical protein